MAVKATVSSVLLTVFLPSYFLIAFWREKKNVREIHYREHLFNILSANVDEVFLIHNLNNDSLEYISTNCEMCIRDSTCRF